MGWELTAQLPTRRLGAYVRRALPFMHVSIVHRSNVELIVALGSASSKNKLKRFKNAHLDPND